MSSYSVKLNIAYITMCQWKSNKNAGVVDNLLIPTCACSGFDNIQYTQKKKFVSKSPSVQEKEGRKFKSESSNLKISAVVSPPPVDYAINSSCNVMVVIKISMLNKFRCSY